MNHSLKSYFAAFLAIALTTLSIHAQAATASYYADKFNGRKTANGERFSNQGMTCASNQFKLGSYVKVINAKNGKSIICKVNDRIGKSGRIDLTKKAFSHLAPLSQGIVKVHIKPTHKKPRQTTHKHQPR
ncbi:septal ring lytic transglycosylase RlpA family protein [Moraxella nasovis]|uniref:septal ring lytic transglycosylase RlpA family protein n=1 Tax=Moraxella nasovis TaxID=2904121 RepID=UPI001F614714|nr:septal ring lytic transglycosylase RlpA family protein [Moraxella nasovis]UNU73307.1 septal ring lytic transglycosylase RlpA family protein [Moraxella nasovis]